MDWLERDLNEIKEALGKEAGKIRGHSFLITGGAGFLGSWMCDAILFLGGKVVCLDNFSAGDDKNISHLKSNKNFELVRGDAAKFATKKKFDYIMHLAGIASPRLYQKMPIETLDSGVIGTRNMLDLASKIKPKSFLFTSTSEIYGNPPGGMIPTPETYYGYVNSYGPRSMYDESKRCAEAYCYSFWKQWGVPVRISRIFNTYGPRLDTKNPGGRGRALIKFVHQAINNEPIGMYGGEQTRSFCYVTDQISGLIKLSTSENLDGEVLNLGNSSETKINDLINTIISISGSSSKIIKPKPDYDLRDDPERRSPDISKARKILGWEPRIGLEEGIMRTIEWMKATK